MGMISLRGFKKNNGFTLIEMLMAVMVIGILSVVSINYMQNDISEIRFDETLNELEKIKFAMVGDESVTSGGERISFGFQGDIGGMPATLAQLLTNVTYPAWSMNSTYRVGIGWNGPYLSSETGNDVAKDAWGNNYIYNSASNPVTVISYGADGAVGGAGLDSDITVSIPLNYYQSDVYGFISDGSNPYVGGAVIELYTPNGAGVITTRSLAITAADSGYFSFLGVSAGVRSISVYIPNKTTPTTIMGPAIVVIDKPKFMIPSTLFNINSGGGGGGCPASTAIQYVTGSANYPLGVPPNKRAAFNVNVTGALTISSIQFTHNVSGASITQVVFPSATYDCTLPTAFAPCPVASGVETVPNPVISMSVGNNQTITMTFDTNVKGNITSLEVYVVHSLGCTLFTITDFI